MLSYTENIPAILKAVEDSGANKILDVGAGMGKYGLLIKEQSISSRAGAGDMIPDDIIRIDAVEHNPYFYSKPHFRWIYNDIYSEDIFHIHVGGLVQRKYELFLLIDIVEHYDKRLMLSWMNSIHGPFLVSTPKQTVMYTQHYYGDPHHHCSQWDRSDFSGWKVKDYSTDQSHIFLLR